MPQAAGIARGVREVLGLVVRLSWGRLLYSWIYIPSGVLCVLLACWGVKSLISLSSISFPASVALLVLLFGFLILSESTLGEKKTKTIVRVIDIPCGFALRYINVFFTPSFVLLPLSPHVSGVEVGKIIGVFVLGFFLVLSATAYFTRCLQIVLGATKRGMTERAEELGSEDDAIPLTQPTQLPVEATEDLSRRSFTEELRPPSPNSSTQISAPSASQDPSRIRGTGGPPADEPTHVQSIITIPRQDSAPPAQTQRWAAMLSSQLHLCTYIILFIGVGVPIFYVTGYAMPVQLCLNILAYFGAVALPPRYKRFLHPVLVSSAITILGVWMLALSHRKSLRDGLEAYSTKTRYLQLFNNEARILRPGAGDVFGSLLDVSIVALALPMFQYRKELKRHFTAIIIPNVVIAIASLFGYPALCVALGISQARSLSFASRSLTLALATPATYNLGGDSNLVAVLCIMSGILGVLVGPPMLRWLRIPEDDYVTRGVTLGSNSSAIATALLLTSDPRAAALSSLSMSLFGTVMVALTSIPPVVSAVLNLMN